MHRLLARYGWLERRGRRPSDTVGSDRYSGRSHDAHVERAASGDGASRPQVQVAYLAYPGTTGLSAIDYRLTDPYLDPPGETDTDSVEQSVRLSETFWCYDSLANQLRSECHCPPIARGRITFGCLNNFCKVSDVALAIVVASSSAA